MRIERTAAGVSVLAPAKLNLFLEVLARRADGFHEIETMMVPINWFDTLSFQDDPGGEIRLDCRWAPGLLRQPRASPIVATEKQPTVWEELPAERNNLAWRAVELLRQEAGLERGAKMQLIKRIPAAAGLGGGSSDAAAALVAANIGWKLHWPLERLAAIAAWLGSDVPFFLGSGPAVCRGRGERIGQIVGLGRLHLVVVRPPEGLATAAVYRECRPAGSPREVRSLLAALRSGDLRRLRESLFNRLEEAASCLSGWIARATSALVDCGCDWAQMSGSGTSCFGLVANAHQARCVAHRLRARGWEPAMAVQSI